MVSHLFSGIRCGGQGKGGYEYEPLSKDPEMLTIGRFVFYEKDDWCDDFMFDCVRGCSV